MAEVGSLWVRLRGDTKDFEKAMKGISKTLDKTGERISGVGNTLTTGLTVPIIALGTAAFAAATSVEGAMANIRKGTGATGEELQALGDDFRAVFKRVPQNAQEVSGAIADLNTRLGLTGEPLRTLSEQMLELADLTGGQVAPLIASTTRVFGDWGTATEKQAGTLDLLWKVSQTTGIEVGRLADSLVQFGAPLRQMGFSLEESAALMGKWEKEGVNMELVLGSLRMAMGHFADEGIPMRQGLDETMRRIQQLGAGAEATSLAMEVFGARAGPDMAAAILEGRFAIDDLMKQLQASGETIMAAGAETETFAEKLAVLRNNATLAFEPIGVKLMSAMENILPQLIAVIERVAQLATWFGNLSPQTQTTILAVVGFAAVLGPLLIAIGKIVTAIGGAITTLGTMKVFLFGTGTVAGGAAVKVGILSGALIKLQTALLPLKVAFLAITAKLWLIIAAVVAFVAWLYLLITHWEEVGETLAAIGESIVKSISGAFQTVKNLVTQITSSITGTFTRLVDGIQDIFRRVVDAITWPFRKAAEIIGNITDNIRESLNRINPFARSSPSLVDNVRAGVRMIQDEYGKLESLQLPSVAAMPQADMARNITTPSTTPEADHARSEASMYRAFYDAFVDASRAIGQKEIKFEINGKTLVRAVLPDMITEGQRTGGGIV